MKVPLIKIAIEFDPNTKQISLFAPPLDKVVMLGLLEMTKMIVATQPVPGPLPVTNGEDTH